MRRSNARIAEHGARLALVLWPGVQYRTGQAFDCSEIARLAHAQGAIVGFDLAHAVGNVPLQLHDSDADFAVWCHYKYMNSGPGAVAGCFVHERHANTDRPRFAGWWGHDQATRFRMGPQFVPTPGADGWQLSAIRRSSRWRRCARRWTCSHAPAWTRCARSRCELTAYLESLIRERAVRNAARSSRRATANVAAASCRCACAARARARARRCSNTSPRAASSATGASPT